MGLRQGDCPKSFKLYEGEEHIGDIEYHAPEEEGDEECWTVCLWSLMGTGAEWHGDPDSFEEAVQFAHELYEEFVAERRKLTRATRDGRPISTPMGGQSRR
ncbi:hypothetical protein ACGF5F_32740 [Streptomyces sp. NPDC047821]|uniref:hypothetical protein n=1 Tax=Streptomyces sp. NPDC047821 TaxID=3365488 RepID=UPI00371D89B5